MVVEMRAVEAREPVRIEMYAPASTPASLSALPATKRGTLRFGILMAAPVCGFRAVRALRALTLKVPKPTSDTASPFLSDFVMLSSTELTAVVACVLVKPSRLTSV